MKKQFYFMMICVLFSLNAMAQSISFTAVPTTVQAGTLLTVSYRYTATADVSIACGVNLFNGWTWVSYHNGQEKKPAVAGTNVTGTFSFVIKSDTTPSANLASGHKYLLKLEMYNLTTDQYITGATAPLTITADPSGIIETISFTAMPTAAKVGVPITVSYKYTAKSPVNISCEVNLQDGWTLVSNVGSQTLNSAVAGSNITGTFTFNISPTAIPSRDLLGNLNYKIHIEMKNTANQQWIAGVYPETPFNVRGEPLIFENGFVSLWSDTNLGVGIGTKFAKSKLDVKGNLTVGSGYAGVNAAPENGAIFEGKVGIGITNPTENLHVNGTVLATTIKKLGGTASQFLLADGTTTTAVATSSIYSANGTLTGSRTITMGANPLSFTGTGNFIVNAGNVGIGTTTPTDKLQVNGTVSGLPATLPHQFVTKAQLDAKVSVSGTANYLAKYTSNIAIGNSLIIDNGTNIGIGSSEPDEKLTVKGKIHAEEVIIDLNVPADYVFEKYYTGKSNLKTDYTMPTLTEVEQFTKENHHLPNVPSAKEIQEKGLQLGEMSNILLQKIEELTLYLIEQNKKIEQQNKEIEGLKKRF